MRPNPVFDVTSGRATRLDQLRTAIAAGSYSPDLDSVAESLVGWIATPEQFDRPVKKFSDDADQNVQTAKDHHSRR